MFSYSWYSGEQKSCRKIGCKHMETERIFWYIVNRVSQDLHNISRVTLNLQWNPWHDYWLTPVYTIGRREAASYGLNNCQVTSQKHPPTHSHSRIWMKQQKPNPGFFEEVVWRKECVQWPHRPAKWECDSVCDECVWSLVEFMYNIRFSCIDHSPIGIILNLNICGWLSY